MSILVEMWGEILSEMVTSILKNMCSWTDWKYSDHYVKRSAPSIQGAKPSSLIICKSRDFLISRCKTDWHIVGLSIMNFRDKPWRLQYWTCSSKYLGTISVLRNIMLFPKTVFSASYAGMQIKNTNLAENLLKWQNVWLKITHKLKVLMSILATSL